MADKIRVNYAALEDMAQHMQVSSDRLAQTAALGTKFASQMQNGALVGQAGDIFVQAFALFSQKVTKLSEKYMEEARDIRQAMNDMRAADTDAGNKF